MKAILWDMDGTLVNTEHLWGRATYAMAAEMGRPLTPEVRALTIGGTMAGTIRILGNYAGIDINEDMVAHWKRWMITRMEQYLGGDLDFRPNVAHLIAEAKATGIPMALVTNTTRHLTNVALRSMYRTIGTDAFAFTLCGDEVAEGKPAPDIYVEAARRLGLSPEECLVVEDSSTGMTSAFSAGCRVLGVPVEPETVVPAEVRTLADMRTGTEDLSGLSLQDLQRIYEELGQTPLNNVPHATMEAVTASKNFDSLFAELKEKAEQRPVGSGTVKALDAGVHYQGKKIVEEAAEVWMAAEYQSDEELSEEISQLLYWLQVVMIQRGLQPEDIYKHL